MPLSRLGKSEGHLRHSSCPASEQQGHKAVAFDISEDKVEWTEAGAMDFPDSPTPVMRILVLPGKATGRYFRLKGTGSNNAPHASLSEVILYQRL